MENNKFTIGVLILLINSLSGFCENFNDNDLILDSENLVNSVFNSFLSNSSNYGMKSESDSSCEKQFNEIILGIVNEEKWAMEFIDSWGKIPSGILWGHVAALGNYDECMLAENTTYKIQGKYCLATIPMDILIKLLGILQRARMFIPGSSDTKTTLQIGVCVPKSCNAEDLKKLLDENLSSFFNLTFNTTGIFTDSDCSTKDPKTFTAIDWVAIVIFSCFGFIMVACSIYDYVVRLKEGPGHQLFLSFSILSNGEKLFKMKKCKNSNVIECLHGIRSLSIIWVVFGHTYAMLTIPPKINLKYVIEWLQSFFSLFLHTAPVSVDSFFLMSGLLVSWTMMKELKKSNGFLNVPLIYFHRYLRLTPVYAALILFSVSLARHSGSGPYWGRAEPFLVTTCNDYWWSALLYVQNYVNPNQMCLGHTWYLSVDTQLYLISPFVMICLWKWGWKVIIIILGVMCASIGYTFAIFYDHEFPMLLTQNLKDSQRRMELTYYPTHTRLPAWFVGILLGYFLYTMKDRKIRLPKFVAAVIWISSFTIMAAIIFGPYPKIQPGGVSSAVESALYESFIRVSWAIALGMIIFMCHTGTGGIINTILSFPFWQPISRLSYCIYLSHFVFEAISLSNIRHDIYFSDYDVIYRFWADFAFTIMISILLTLAFESPIVGIEKILFHQKKASLEIQNKNEGNGTHVVNET